MSQVEDVTLKNHSILTGQDGIFDQYYYQLIPLDFWSKSILVDTVLFCQAYTVKV
jgi:hypothetical protein